MQFPYDSGVVPMDSLMVSFMSSIHIYIYIYAGYGVPVPRAPQDQDRLMEPLRHLMSPSTG